MYEDEFKYIIVTPPSNGCEVRFKYSGVYPWRSRYLQFRAPPAFTGKSTFTYKVSDGELETPTATVTVTVHGKPTGGTLCGASYWIPLGAAQDKLKLPAGGWKNHAYEYSSYGGFGYARVDDPEVEFSPNREKVKYEIVTPPVHGTMELTDQENTSWYDRGKFTYVPDEGFMGEDYAYVRIFNGLVWSEPTRLRFIVRDGGKPAGAQVNIIVEQAMLTELFSEVQRLKADMENEGWTARIVACTPGMTARDVWQSLRDDYLDETKCLAGCVLIGAVPVPGSPHNLRQLWRYRETQVEDLYADIFVSYYMGGATVQQMKNALEANHNYRIGKSRIGQKFMHDYDSRDFTDRSASDNYMDLWPDQTSYEVGGRMFDSYGYEAVYMLEHDYGGNGGYSSTYTVGDSSTPQLFRFWFDEGCGSAVHQRGRLY
jgi:hypothetical protein